MIEIIPAFLEKKYEEVERKAARVRGFVKAVQLDVMDGAFVPETSWPYEETRHNGRERLLAGAIPLPFFEDFLYEIDLMIERPEEDIPLWLTLGASRLVVHSESTKNLEEIVISYGKNILSADPRKEGFLQSMELGLSLNIETPNEMVEPYAERVNFIQFMGINKIGFQGQPFDERVLKKIYDLREKFPKVTISVDGGVSLETAPRLVEAGANRLVSGSAIWKSENLEETIEKFKSIVS